MSIWLVVWVVLMILWIAGGVYTRDPARPYAIGNTVIAWVCVLILGLIVFGALPVAPQPAIVIAR